MLLALIHFSSLAEVVSMKLRSANANIKKSDEVDSTFSKPREVSREEERQNTVPTAADAEMRSLDLHGYHPAVQHNERKEDPQEKSN